VNKIQKDTAKAVRNRVEELREHSRLEGGKGIGARRALGVLSGLTKELAVILDDHDSWADRDKFEELCGFGYGVSVWYGTRDALPISGSELALWQAERGV
jgi:hypothetical protein